MPKRHKAKTVSVKKVTKESLRIGRIMYPDDGHARPRTRGECRYGLRPCPYVSCRHHLYLDIDAESGAMKYNFPGMELDELAETCSLDVAERGGNTLDEVGALLNLTRERVRQLEVQGLNLIREYDTTHNGILKRMLAGMGRSNGSAEEGYETVGIDCSSWGGESGED